MHKRWFICGALFAVLFVSPALRAGEKTAPHIVVRAKSLDTIFDNVKLMLRLVGQENLAEHIEGLIKTKVGVNGLEGIDPKRPFGAYARVTEDTNQSHGVAMIPIADEKAFLRLLTNLNYQARKGDNGVYSINVGLPADVHFRFANGYAYVTFLQLRALDKANLATLDAVFPKNDTSVLSMTVNLAKIPKAAKFIPSQLLEDFVAKAQEKEIPGITPTQDKFRQRLLTTAAKQIDRAIQEGGELSIAFAVDAKTKKVTADVTLNPAANTQLQSDFAKLAKRSSVFGAVVGSKAAVGVHGHLLLPTAAMATYQAMVDELVEAALGQVADPAKRAEAEKFIRVLTPTFKAGEFEGMISVDGPSKDDQFTVLAGLRLKDGTKVEQTLRDLLKKALATASAEERKRIELDAVKVGNTNIHRVAVPIPDEKVRQYLGDHPLYTAFRDDAIFIAVGQNGLAAIKKAVASQPTSTGTLLNVEVDLARIAPLLANSVKQRTAMRKIFANGDSGRVQFSLQSGASLRLRFAADLTVVQVISQLAQQKDVPLP